ncbi:hypothetical protein BMETH_2041_0 [methanotrophic bacterial endosymbiont of Bathymodiolus sp.]|nr:hypothetical protein BMETH_2041_0 [methanotrophic bacterial endosymbiont of Bathymodiolus sp.]
MSLSRLKRARVCVSVQFRCTIQNSIFLNEELSWSARVL